MTDSLAAIRREIAELRDALAGINARREQIDPEIQDHEADIAALREERIRCLHDSEQAAHRITALQRAESVLIEHSAPEPVEPDPVPVPTPEPMQEQLPLTRTGPGRGHRADGQPNRRQDPSIVIPRQGGCSFQSPRISSTAIADGGYAYLDMDNLSPTDTERADLVYEILAEAPDGEMTQYDICVMLKDLMDIDKDATASKTGSRALAVLYKQDRIVDTGVKGAGPSGHRNSPIWKTKSAPNT